MDPLSRALLIASGGGEFVTDVEYIAETTVAATNTNGITSITLTGIQSGDIVFFTWCADGFAIDNLENSWATTEGSIWSAATGSVGAINSPNMKTYWKEATGTSITVDTGFTSASENTEYSMSLIAFRGLNTTTPVSFVGSTELTFGNTSTLDLADYTEGLADFNSYLFAVVGFDDAANVTLTPPATYTKINQADSDNPSGVNATQSSAYSNYTAGTSRSGEAYSSSGTDQYNTYLWLLIPSGEETNPVITGSTLVQAAAGGTAVATYTADQTVTWSLEGTDASLFSISSGGVVTYNSASVLGSYNFTVVATNGSNLLSKLSVVVDAYVSGGAAGGGITLVDSTSDAVINGSNTTLTLTGLQSGDVVYFMSASDVDDGSRLSESGGWSGWSDVTELNLASPTLLLRSKVTSSTSESVTLTITGGGNGYRHAASLFAFRGVDNTDPISAENGRVAGSTVGNQAGVLGGYMLAATVRIIWCGLDNEEGVTTTPPAGYTEIIDQNSIPAGSSSNGATLFVAYKDVNSNTTEADEVITFTKNDNYYSGGWQFRPD